MSSKRITINIDGKTIKCSSDDTVMEVARANGIDIPGLCYHPDFPPKGNCRVCVVEDKDTGDLFTSCTMKAKEGMRVSTTSAKVRDARNLNIELIFSEHIQKCNGCIWRVNCQLLELARKYDVNVTRFSDRKGKRKVYKFANAVEVDGTQCIDCRNCLHACQVLQNIHYLKLQGKGYHQEVAPVRDKNIDCIYCGQCAVHCPVGAAQEQQQWREVEKKLKNKNKVVIAQFAPSIRVSIGEEFGMGHGRIVTDQVVGALKELGFDHVFDVNFGADITTMIEAHELLDRLKTKESLPMITSCCPAWVKYAEFYYPQILPYLTTSRSPHIHLGGVIKTYWAQKMGIKPKDIEIVSVMPCTAKKFEAGRSELKIGGRNPVDNVITTREFAWLLKKNRIDFKKVKKAQADDPLGEYSGAAAIYGGSGGVMESALRTAHYLAGEGTGSRSGRKIDFKQVRGSENVREAAIGVGGKKLKVAVVNGIKGCSEVIEKMERYHYIEVMACPGGCIGGGGQPIPTTKEIREKRIAALYRLDKSKKVRQAHKNAGVEEVLKWLGRNGTLRDKVLYTNYKKRR